jgi:hypothetical protein
VVGSALHRCRCHTPSPPPIAPCARFSVFRYLFEKRRAVAGAGLGTIRYLDLSTSLRTAQVYQAKTFKEIRGLWTLLLAGPPAADKLAAHLERLGTAEAIARAAFRSLLLKHSYSPQVTLR